LEDIITLVLHRLVLLYLTTTTTTIIIIITFYIIIMDSLLVLLAADLVRLCPVQGCWRGRESILNTRGKERGRRKEDRDRLLNMGNIRMK